MTDKTDTQASFQPKFHEWNLDKVLLSPWYKQMFGLGTWTRQSTNQRVVHGAEVERQDFMRILMQTADPKRDLALNEKEMWLEVFMMAAVGECLLLYTVPFGTYSIQHRRPILLTLLCAATATTSIPPLLSTIFFYLLHYPHALERLTDEIRTAFQEESSIRIGSTLNSCSYLFACIDEAFRMTPQVANTLFRDVLPGGATVQGDFFPEGTMIGAAIWSVHRNKDHFAQPNKFLPERFLAATQQERTEKKRCFFPFSTGPRTCPGQRFAYVMLALVVAKTVHRYDIRLSPRAPCCGRDEHEKCTDRSFSSWIGLGVEGPVAQFRRRGE